LAIPAASVWYGRGDACASCHEIQDNVASWGVSAHQKVPCGACHGSVLSLDAGFHLGNARRLYKHMRGELPEQIRLKQGDVSGMMDRCRQCHQREFADWKSGPHGVSFEKTFTDAAHNQKRQLMDDCLRCHGMYFEGGVRDLVGPQDRKGPWKLIDAAMAQEPSIPCLACHSMHAQAPGGKKGWAVAPSLAFHDRRSQRPVTLARLPMPELKGVKRSPDQRQALCYQCHAPWHTGEVGSGDDRTPAGVHEGISCLACHQKHGQSATASCATCHPKMSNCGLDVERMDTTFKDTKSKHNVHWVACGDCHEGKRPVRKKAAGAVVASRQIPPAEPLRYRRREN
jgi:hypothetical protein